MRANTLLRTHRNTPGFETENKSKQVNTSKQRLPDAVVFNPSAFGSFPRKSGCINLFGLILSCHPELMTSLRRVTPHNTLLT